MSQTRKTMGRAKGRQSFLSAGLGAALAVSLSMVSCGSDKPSSKKEDGSNVVNPEGPGQTGPTTPTGPNGTPGSASPAPAVGAGLTPLWNAIQQGQHKSSSEADKTRLVVQEAQRCRQQGAAIVGEGLSATITPSEEVLDSYRSRHWGPNALSRCRQTLGLVLSWGFNMKVENLVALENCTRLADAAKLANQADRQSEREILMLENLSLLCSLPNDELTTEVHQAVTAGFVQAWTVKGN